MRFAVGVVLASASTACAPAILSASSLHEHAAPSAAPPIASAPELDVASRPSRHPLAAAESCPLAWTPRDVGTVLHIPASVMSPPMAAVVAAACRCVQPGEVVTVVADIDFASGSVRASSSDSGLVDGCLAELPAASFEPWSAGSSASDCVDCGPRHFGVLPGSDADDARMGASGAPHVRYPLRVDRAGEH